MLSRLHSVALMEIEALGCEIEVDRADRGSEKAAIVGLPDTRVQASLERFRAKLWVPAVARTIRV
jgi:predicted ATPase with chaperone activity